MDPEILGFPLFSSSRCCCSSEETLAGVTAGELSSTGEIAFGIFTPSLGEPVKTNLLNFSEMLRQDIDEPPVFQ